MAKAIHIIGIGGVGMSALAQLYLAQGRRVTGADRQVDMGLTTPTLERLRAAGVEISGDNDSLITPETEMVVISTAIEHDNPGLARAAELGIFVMHRAAALAKALEGYKLVAVAGTCGKSTVTAMLGHILAECGMDPVVVNGAPICTWNGAVRFGKGRFAVAEVDESDKSLVVFRPYAAVITNASADHYSLEEMNEVFDAFARVVPGPIVDGRKEQFTPSDAAKAVAVPGEHNAMNAEHALRMAVALGADPARAAAALKTFPGVERRMQRISSPAQVPAVFDDYAHNPEKLAAMWCTFASQYSRIAVVWRPHGYAPLRKMMTALAEMFRATVRKNDLLVLLPVYDAGGTTSRDVNSADLAALLNGVNVQCVATLDDAFALLKSRANDFDAFVTCGARDPGLPVLAQRLAEIKD